ncbi:MAG: 6,7-dimethyl-8-ribityllumazine synthase [Candidatus Electryonea clarkiae]|nr:6,7-dimethyl-8-ribityllumazine synthase [Candidatus Electryonea clarkiae]MDP8285376.1 6,7-dimethyl-8-ribityllumazine synthase [Candidatus Electryonea clarkiae]
MPKIIEGVLDAKGRKFGIVVGRFNHFITDRLLEGALDGLLRHGAQDDDITVVRVPGSFEIPSVVKKLAESGKVDAVIGMGALIRGATSHYDHISNEVTKGLAQVSMEGKVPVIYGILSAETLEQAIERAGTKGGNRGFAAAESAVEMVNLFENLD